MSKRCTFAKTGSSYTIQEWYECYTCDLTNGSGFCSVCKDTCHRGHNISAPKNSKFYCDCGAEENGGRGCSGLNPKGGKTVRKKPVPQKAPSTSRDPPPPPLSQGPPPSVLTAAKTLRVDANDAVIRLPPLYFVHVLDTNDNTTAVYVGPTTITRRDHENLVLGPQRMVIVPPGHYCTIKDPVVRSAEGEPQRTDTGQWKLRFGDHEVRLAQEPFPLYPGETLKVDVSPLQTVLDGHALRLRAIHDLTDLSGTPRRAGDEWLFRGPATYIPEVDVKILKEVQSERVAENTALRMRARYKCVDSAGVERKAGEEWLMREPGLYLPEVGEEVVRVVQAYILTDKEALHLRATRTFTDVFGVKRKAGAEWLVTKANADTHIPDVYEEVVKKEVQQILTNRQFCVVLDPVDANGMPQLGQKVVRRGPCVFFKQPGEQLENGIENVHILSAQEALLCRARESFMDGDVKRQPGDRWLVRGPNEYFPPVEVEILDRRSEIPLDLNEGVYIRDGRSGLVSMVVGRSYMRQEYEELFEKEVPPKVASLVEPRTHLWEVVRYRVGHKNCCQIYNFRSKESRVVMGPNLILLAPDEQFTQLSLSGGKPKKGHQIRALELHLGPDFMTDIVTVETSDHARLSLKLSYKWQFDVDPAQPERLFSVPDFVGDACKAIASRVRGRVACVPFDEFHKHSSELINAACFGTNADGSTKTQLRFDANGLVINAVDVMSVEPVDQRTRDALQKSVQMAIEITTSSQEASAQHLAAQTEQKARAALERQKIADEARAERARSNLLELKAKCAAVTTTGAATAEAKAQAEAAEIEGMANVEQADLKQQAQNIESTSELTNVTMHQECELEHQKQLNLLEIERAAQLAEIETTRFRETVEAIGAETIKAMAQAGPEMQAKLLAGLGLEGYLVTDGNSPINLFNTANGLVGGGMPGQE